MPTTLKLTLPVKHVPVGWHVNLDGIDYTVVSHHSNYCTLVNASQYFRVGEETTVSVEYPADKILELVQEIVFADHAAEA